MKASKQDEMIKLSKVSTSSFIKEGLNNTILNSCYYPVGCMGFISFEFNATDIFFF